MIKIQLTQGLEVIVDDEDLSLVSGYAWYAAYLGKCRSNPRGTPYAVAHVSGGLRESGKDSRKTVLMHRLILGLQDRELGDHRNGNTMDNRRDNLRKASRTQNRANGRTSSKSGYKGVYRHGKGWIAQIRFESRLYDLGKFPTPEEAARAYDRKAIEFFGEFARPNFSESLKAAS